MDESSCQVLDNSWIRWKCWLFPFTSDSASWHAGIFAIINGSALIANVPLRYCFYGGHDRMSLSCSYGLRLEVAGCNLARSGNHSLGWGVNALLYGCFINSVRCHLTFCQSQRQLNAFSPDRYQSPEHNEDLALWTMRFSCNMLCVPRKISSYCYDKTKWKKMESMHFLLRKLSITIWVKFRIENV